MLRVADWPVDPWFRWGMAHNAWTVHRLSPFHTVWNCCRFSLGMVSRVEGTSLRLAQKVFNFLG